jgi:hypothetical protein
MAGRGRPAGGRAALRLAVMCRAETPNGRYRALLPLRELARRGHTVRLPGHSSYRALEGNGVPDWDLVHVQQLLGEERLRMFERLRAHGVAVVWDSDDDILATPKGSETYKSLGGRRKIRRLFEHTVALGRAAHLMTTTNEHLAQVYRDAGVEHVVAIENHLGQEDVRGTRRRHQGVVLGITAAEEHESDLRRMRFGEKVHAVLRAHEGVRAVAIGAELGIRDHRYTHVREVPHERLIAAEREFDIGLAPLCDTRFNHARSNVKLKEYAAAGAMWCASPVGPYRGMGEEQGGLLVEDDAWTAVLGSLVEDPERRRELARRAEAWAERQTIAHAVEQWERAFRGAILRAREGMARR